MLGYVIAEQFFQQSYFSVTLSARGMVGGVGERTQVGGGGYYKAGDSSGELTVGKLAVLSGPILGLTHYCVCVCVCV